MQCRLTNRQEEEEIKEVKDVKDGENETGSLERGDDSQDGGRDEERITEERRPQRRQGGRCRERYLVTSTR